LINFTRPWMFWLLAILPALAGFMWAAALARKSALKRFGNPELLERSGTAVSSRMRIMKSVLILCAAALMVIALAGPQWGATREKIERKGVDVMVALDTSSSMLARDVAPSRMHKAKQAIRNLIELMQGDRIGIVAFAGAALTMCPLTLDYNAAVMFLDVMDTRTVPEPGTDLSEALREAANNFVEGSEKYKVLILISDGEHLEDKEEDPVEVAEDLAEKGVVIYTVGVGSGKGASIPIETEDGVVDKTDRQGEVVITRLDEEMLRKIALAGEGKYRRLDNAATGKELADIYAGIAGMEKKTFEEMYQVHYEDRFQWFVAAALMLVTIEMALPERKRK